MNKSFKNFMENIKYIYPEEIASENETKAYKNLRNENPNKSENKNKNKVESSTSEKESSSSSFTPFENAPRNSNQIIFSSDNDVKKKEKGRFGQHENFSFFESFSREMIFQIFNYHQMYFFNYDITYSDRIGDNNKIGGKENNKINKEQNLKNLEITNIDKGKDKEQEHEQAKKEVQNGETNIENKKEESDAEIKPKEDKNEKGSWKSDNEIKNLKKKKKGKANFKSDNDKKNKSKNKISFQGDIDAKFYYIFYIKFSPKKSILF